MLLGECQELSREIATDIAIECHQVRYPEAVEDREQKSARAFQQAADEATIESVRSV